MSTMFSGAGSSSAASVGSGEAAAAAKSGPQSATPGTQNSQPSQTDTSKTQGVSNGSEKQEVEGGEPFFREVVKVDGKDVEIAYKTRQELADALRKAKAADKRFEEGARYRKEAEQRWQEAQAARAEADELRKKYGDDTLMAAIDSAIASGDPQKIQKAREVMENKLAGLIRREMMDPKERELVEREERIKAKEQEYQTKEEQEKQVQLKAQTDHWRQEFTNTIIGALETGNVPNTDWSASIMANLLRHNMQKGYKLTPEALAQKTQQVIMNQVTGLLDKASGDQLIEWFPDLIKKVRAADLKRIRSRQPNQPKKVLETPKPDNTKPAPTNRYMSPDEWREWTKKRVAAAQAGQPLPD